MDGEFRRTTKDKWSFDGKLKAYANPFSDRNAIADLSTKVLDLIGKTGGGTPFEIAIDGTINVHFDQSHTLYQEWIIQ